MLEVKQFESINWSESEIVDGPIFSLLPSLGKSTTGHSAQPKTPVVHTTSMQPLVTIPSPSRLVPGRTPQFADDWQTRRHL